jgi:hypothetical protein
MSKQNERFDPNKWFAQEYLRIKTLLCLARDVDPHDEKSWPPPGEWRARWEALKAAIDDGELTASPTPALGNTTAVKLENVWIFVCSRETVADWGWLHDLCERWAEVCGVTRDVMPEDDDRPPEDSSRSVRQTDLAYDNALKIKIRRVLKAARDEWPDPEHRPEIKPMAIELARKHGKKLGYSATAIRLILRGKYRPARRLGISGL